MKYLAWKLHSFAVWISSFPKILWNDFINQPLWDIFRDKESTSKYTSLTSSSSMDEIPKVTPLDEMTKVNPPKDECKEVHYPPFLKPIGYEGIYKCEACKALGDVMHISLYKPCPNCGQRDLIVEVVAKWVDNKWEIKK